MNDFGVMDIKIPTTDDRNTVFNICHEQIREFIEGKIYEIFPDNHGDLDHFNGNSTGKCSDDYEALWTDHIGAIAAAIRDGKSVQEIQQITFKVMEEVRRVVKKLKEIPVEEWSDHYPDCICNRRYRKEVQQNK